MKLFKEPIRFSSDYKPTIGMKLIFSYAHVLTSSGVSLPNKKSFCKNYIHNDSMCEVISLTEHLVEVRFDNQTNTDLVSPEFLIFVQLTKIGTKLIGDNWDKMMSCA